MALPASGQLSLSEIATELGAGATNNSLKDMSATAGFSSPDAISEFYGYSAVTYSSFYMSTVSYASAADACLSSFESTTLRYHNGAVGLPSNGDTIYTNNTGTIFSGDGNYYFTDIGPTSFICSAGGVVSSYAVC